MKKETICKIAEGLGEGLIIAAHGLIAGDILAASKTIAEKVIITAGVSLSASVICSAFSKQFYETCDDILDTNLLEESKKTRY